MLYAIVAVIALIIDQAVKYWTTANIVLNEGTKDLIPGLIRLTNIHNTGAAFSILEGARWFFVVLCIAFVALIIYVLVKDIINTPIARWMAVMVMAGAVGNCIDRVICGYVVDMFEFEFMTFPIFNVADIYITVCGVLFCLFTLLEKPRSADEAKAKAEPAEKKSFALPRRKKVVIPDFPKREKVETEAPKVDPNDPFAEWERRAAETKAQSEAPEAQSASSGAALKAEAEEFVRAHSEPEVEAEFVEVKPIKTVEVPVYQQPAKAEEVKPQPAKPAQTELPKAVEEFDFNLDDILAEFGDL